MFGNLAYLYLLSPLHTGGTTQEGNLLGIARESHTDLPYIPSSSIRGRLRSSIDQLNEDKVDQKLKKVLLFGSEIDDSKDQDLVQRYKEATNRDLNQLVQGDIWIGDGSILWLPVPSLSHGVIWISSPLLLRRWARLNPASNLPIPPDYSTNLGSQKPIYLKDAILKAADLNDWSDWKSFMPDSDQIQGVERVLVLPDKHCATLIQMSLWRQVKIKLDQHKSVDGGFRYEEAIPPDTLMYFPWGIISQANGTGPSSQDKFEALMTENSLLQIGGQESLGRGFVETWLVQQGRSKKAEGRRM